MIERNGYKCERREGEVIVTTPRGVRCVLPEDGTMPYGEDGTITFAEASDEAMIDWVQSHLG